MHPEIRQDHAGNCPKCGIDTWAGAARTRRGESRELADFERRFWWTLPLSASVFVLAMFGHRVGWFRPGAQSWIELALTLPVVFLAGARFFARGAKSIARGSPNMWTLISLGTGAAFVYSVAATLEPQWFPASFVSMARLAVYFEAAR